MAEELINFDLPVERSSMIKVIGVGGGGNNAVNYMFRQGIKDVNFVVCNTDAQALENSPVGVKIQLGPSLTEGRGAGNKPDIGRQPLKILMMCSMCSRKIPRWCLLLPVWEVVPVREQHLL